MSFSPLKKITGNIAVPLNELIWQGAKKYVLWGIYLSSNGTFTVPYNGIYDINAYMINNSSAGRGGEFAHVRAVWQKGQVIRWNKWSNNAITITSASKPNLNIYAKNQAVTINAIGDGFIRAIAAGGYCNAATYSDVVEVRCNNGIALGYAGAYNVGNGQSAYAWGDNVYAIGGGGGGYYNNNVVNRAGGKAYVNGEEINEPCTIVNNYVSLASGYGREGGKNTVGKGGTGSSYSYLVSPSYSINNRINAIKTRLIPVCIPRIGNFFSFANGFTTGTSTPFMTIEINRLTSLS